MSPVLPLRCLLRLFNEPEPAGFFRGDLNISENRADRIALTFLDKDLRKASRAWRSHSHYSFVCLDLNEVAIRFNGAALLEQDLNDRCFGDGFAELWHQYWNLDHSVYISKRRCIAEAIALAVGR